MCLRNDCDSLTRYQGAGRRRDEFPEWTGKRSEYMSRDGWEARRRLRVALNRQSDEEHLFFLARLSCGVIRIVVVSFKTEVIYKIIAVASSNFRRNLVLVE